MLNEGNQIHNFISSSGSNFLTSYGSSSTRQKIMVPTVPVPHHWFRERHTLFLDFFKLYRSWMADFFITPCQV